MAALRNARVRADGHGEVTTLESITEAYSHLQRCDPESDLVVVEYDGDVVGYARTTWGDSDEGTRDHWLIVEADVRHPGLDTQLIEWCSSRATANATAMAREMDRPQQIIAEVLIGGTREPTLVAQGFAPIRYGAMMIRPHLRDIPDAVLPDGVEIRPVEDDHLRAIFAADMDAFRDHWGYVEPTEEDWEMFRDSARSTGTSLWQVAWAADEVVGQVRTYVVDGERELFGVHRAWTESISTSRNWRKRGVASAAICSSLRQLAELGFEQAILGVDTQNPNGAFALYESLGYGVVATDAVLARPIGV
jgi:ribosomal protein S18 acetylase RimI-like enzyme